jgi:succinoglycan biosynthesis transport protein ExoP
MQIDSEKQIDIRDYLQVTLNRRWTILGVFLLVVLSTAIFSFTATPIYEASVRLIIEKENPNVVSVQEVMTVDASGTDYYQTQYKIIESRSVAREVIERLGLAQSEEFAPKRAEHTVARFFYAIKDTFISMTDSLLDLLNREPGSNGEGNSVPDQEIVTEFIERVDIEPIRNSRLVDIKFQAKDPALAAKIVQTVAQVYIDQSLATKLEAVQGAVKWLHQRIEQERRKVEEAEKALLQYKEENNIITDFSSDTEKITAQKLAELNTQMVGSESVRVEAETRYKQALSLAKNPEMLDSIPEVLSNELIRQIKSMEVDLYKRMSELSKKYGSKHPQMIAIRSELRTLKSRKQQEISRVVNSLKNEYEVALAREESLKDALSRQKRELLNLNQKAIAYGVLRREAESAREMYELLIKRFKETTLTEDMRTGNIRIVDAAEVPSEPIRPRKRLNILLAMLIGLFLGLGLAFFCEHLDNTIKTADDIRQYLKTPFLGPVPVLTADNGADPRRNGQSRLVTLHAPRSTGSEAYRGIRTNILFASQESEPRCILVSSSGPEEGKTLTVSNLAVTMAQSGSQVVVLDCDLRRPKLHSVFNLQPHKGITNLLTGHGRFTLANLSTGIPNLYVIPAGPIPTNPTELIGSTRMKALIMILRRKFDRVIIDSPPVAAVTDAALLSKYVDGVVFVLRAHSTIRSIAVSGMDQFRAVGANVLGVVLNAVDFSRDRYNYPQYYYYYGDGREGKKGRIRKLAPKALSAP